MDRGHCGMCGRVDGDEIGGGPRKAYGVFKSRVGIRAKRWWQTDDLAG